MSKSKPRKSASGKKKNKKRTVVFRKPKKSELPEVVKVLNSDLALYRTVYSDRYIEEMGAIGNFTLKDVAPTKKSFDLAAISGKKVIAFTNWYMKKNNVAWISQLVVLPSYRRKGIGMILLRNVEKMAKTKGAWALGAETQRKAYWIAKLNEKFGFRKMTWRDLNRKPFKGTLKKPPVKYTFVWGKEI